MTQHWQQHDEDGIRILSLDMAGQSANVISRAVLEELEGLLTQCQQQAPQALFIRSAKPEDFILGADVTEFEHIKEASEAAALAHRGQQVFAQLAALSMPTVALLRGNCLGGGLELALACDYRIAEDSESTRLGVPEVRLGIHPGFGGTVRLPRLVGALPALDMMLTGRALSARAARRIGLVDELVAQRYLLLAAKTIAEKRPKRRLAWSRRLPNSWLLRPFVKALSMRQLKAKASPDHYPAPYRILELWQRCADEEREAASLGELLVGRTSRNLVHIFMLGESLKREARQYQHEVQHVHVIGAGVMGGDIAAWAVYKGFRVSLQDRKEEVLARAMQRAHALFKKKYKQARDVQAAMDRLLPDLAGDGLARADLVIEAIVENEEIKRKVFAEVEQKVSPHALLASNTSSIPLEHIAKALKDPSRLVGLHFFNPVAKMQLVEIVRGESSSDSAIGRALAFAVALTRLPLEVKSSPGFLVNRILMPYLMEAVNLYEEGVSMADIDKAALDFGMPMGPIHLADVVGLDICLSVAEELADPLGMSVPERLRQMVDAGKLGRKSGEGFYRYDKQGRQKKSGNGKANNTPITERLILRLLNESIACLREGVVRDKNAVDAGMVYGTGFAPYLGGPMSYAESMGETGISHSLYRLAELYGKRFNPDSGWNQPELLQAHQAK